MNTYRIFFIILVSALFSLTACAKYSPYTPPKDSKLAALEVGMTADRVIEQLGMPTVVEPIKQANEWNRTYYPNLINREIWRYKGIGRVVLNRSVANAPLSVVKVEHDPTETATTLRHQTNRTMLRAPDTSNKFK